MPAVVRTRLLNRAVPAWRETVTEFPVAGIGYPNVDYQLEIYDPAPGSAARLVSSGKLAPVSAG